MVQADVIIIGAGASGLMCAITAGRRGKNVIVLDHAKRPGTKILMSGGGRCNFTNLNISAQRYISSNPHFCKSALKQYTQWDFIELVRQHGIRFEEREHGQIFCINSSRDILDMLLKEGDKARVKFNMSCAVEKIEQIKNGGVDQGYFFRVFTRSAIFECKSLVIATGGLSIPSAGATPFGYKIANQFGINILPPHAGLVPFTLNPDDKKIFSALSGIALDATVEIEKDESEKHGHRSTKHGFRENILFTHRGLSGPAILQISSYWQAGENIKLNLVPELDLFEWLITIQHQAGNKENQKQVGSKENQKQVESKKNQQSYGNNSKKLKSILSEILPKRLVMAIIPEKYCETKLGAIPHKELRQISDKLQQLIIKPAGTEGYRTAEVTVGGVDCNCISSKTMESRDVKGLFFTGEVLDVTGWLGGYNLQWAWSSGWMAGMAV